MKYINESILMEFTDLSIFTILKPSGSKESVNGPLKTAKIL